MISLTPDLAEICGIHAGDGYMRTRERNKGEIDISGNVEEKEYYDNHVIPIFNKIFNLNIKGRLFSRGTYGFVCYIKKVRDKFLEMGFPDGKKSLIVRVPKLILNSKDNILYAIFLRGLLDTDGHIGFIKRNSGKYCKFKMNHNYYPMIYLNTISKQLAKDSSYMLNFLDINHFINIYNPKKINEHKRYSIIINGVKRLEKWMKLIGSKNPVKYSRYLIWKKFGFCPTHTTLAQRKDILSKKSPILT